MINLFQVLKSTRVQPFHKHKRKIKLVILFQEIEKFLKFLLMIENLLKLKVIDFNFNGINKNVNNKL